QIENLAHSIEARYDQAMGVDTELPEDGYYGKDIISIGKDLAEKHPEIKDQPEEERIKTFRKLGLDYEMAKLKNDLNDFNIHFDSWFSETSLYEANEITAVLDKMTELGYTFEKDGATWLRTTEFGDDKD
ncbi:arginine--tRNA ligase, partial [Gemella sp. 19428wG2_WT2a]